jgi:hypothetical protein
MNLAQNMAPPDLPECVSAHTCRPRVPKTVAARMLGISLRTVQRYCDLFARYGEPLTDEKGKVNPEGLWHRIQTEKTGERRGYPLGEKRQPSLLIVKRRERKTFGRSFAQRVEFIKNEIDSMSDEQQATLLRNLPSLFRPIAQQQAFGTPRITQQQS